MLRSAWIPKMDPEALTPLVAYLGERKLVLGKNKTCRGWGAGGGLEQ